MGASIFTLRPNIIKDGGEISHSPHLESKAYRGIAGAGPLLGGAVAVACHAGK